MDQGRSIGPLSQLMIYRPISRPTPWPVEAKPPAATASRSVALRREGYSPVAAHKRTQLAFYPALTQINALSFDGADGPPDFPTEHGPLRNGDEGGGD